eukprot:11030638-Alexandrium_andersonii.AAC.1
MTDSEFGCQLHVVGLGFENELVAAMCRRQASLRRDSGESTSEVERIGSAGMKLAEADGYMKDPEP